MLLTEISGQDLHLRLQTPVMGPETGFDNALRIGEVLTFDALELAKNSDDEIDYQIRHLSKQCSFTLIRLPLNIRPVPKATVRFLAVEISFDKKGAVCWSIDPERVEEELKVTSSCTITGSLKAKAAEVSGNRQQSVEFVIRKPQITAFGIGLPNIAWEFSPATEHTLNGIQMLHCVVKSPRGLSVEGLVQIRADVIAHGLLWNTKAISPEGAIEVSRFRIANRK